MKTTPMAAFEINADHSATVLIVDDDPGARLLMGTALEMAGFRVTTAADGVAALAAFKARPRRLRHPRRGHAGHERLRRLRRAAGSARLRPRADLDADQPGRHGIGQQGIHRRRHRFLVQGHQSDAARAAGEVLWCAPSERRISCARARRGCAISPTTISSPHCPTASACGEILDAAGGVGSAAASRRRGADPGPR